MFAGCDSTGIGGSFKRLCYTPLRGSLDFLAGEIYRVMGQARTNRVSKLPPNPVEIGNAGDAKKPDHGTVVGLTRED